MSVVELIDHGWSLLDWMVRWCTCERYTMFICVGLNGLMNTLVL